MMRSTLPALVSIGLLGGCAGNVADYIGSRSSIVRPQLIRYGFELRAVACVGELLGKELDSAAAAAPGPLDIGAEAAVRRRRAADSPRFRPCRHLDAQSGDRHPLKAANAACGVLTEVPSLRPAETGTPPSTSPIPGTLRSGSAAGRPAGERLAQSRRGGHRPVDRGRRGDDRAGCLDPHRLVPADQSGRRRSDRQYPII